jgi:hypothetical protein
MEPARAYPLTDPDPVCAACGRPLGYEWRRVLRHNNFGDLVPVDIHDACAKTLVRVIVTTTPKQP